jgi:hypothetical protein
MMFACSTTGGMHLRQINNGFSRDSGVDPTQQYEITLSLIFVVIIDTYLINEKSLCAPAKREF